MADSIEQLKGIISARGGLARSNRYRVILPALFGLSASDLNLLCKDATLPGRQITTNDRTIGIRTEKTAYGYTTDDVVMTFHITNDHAVRKYFESWQRLAVDPDTYEIGFKKDYSHIVQVSVYNSYTDTLDYTCTLYDAFPVQINTTNLVNDQDGLIDLNVTFSYSNWKSF